MAISENGSEFKSSVPRELPSVSFLAEGGAQQPHALHLAVGAFLHPTASYNSVTSHYVHTVLYVLCHHVNCRYFMTGHQQMSV